MGKPMDNGRPAAGMAARPELEGVAFGQEFL